MRLRQWLSENAALRRRRSPNYDRTFCRQRRSRLKKKSYSIGLLLDDHLAEWRKHGLRVGFTNGCFDLLHPGHVKLLAGARAACDRLVVGLNGDESVTRLKGAGRPVQPVHARAEVLAALEAVDLVAVFDEDTPENLIAPLKPSVLVKGSDYTREEVVGRDIVEATWR